MSLSIPDDLWAHLCKFRNAPALMTTNRTATWGELLDDADSVASALYMQGVRPGDLVALWGTSEACTVRRLFAIWRAGAVAVPLNTRLPVAAAAHDLLDINCRFLLTDERPIDAPITRLSSEPCDQKIELPSFDARRPATALFTSGSSGAAKACLHTFGNHLFNALGANANMPFALGDCWLLSLPLHHVSGIAILFRAMITGAAVGVQDDKPLSSALAALPITHLSLVTTQLLRLLDDAACVKRLQQLKAILLGGSAIPEPLIRRAHDLRLAIFLTYGLTETASQVVTTRPNDDLNDLLAGGRPLPFRELKILDNEIWVRGQTLFRGYLQKEGLRSPMDADGWFATGDLGAMDAQGRLRVIGRRDNLFISGGENIYPEEIERALLRLPNVEQAVVVPLTDQAFGHRPALFLKLKGAEPLDLAVLRDELPGYKIPKIIFAWPEELPTGLKINRRFFIKRAQELFQSRDAK